MQQQQTFPQQMQPIFNKVIQNQPQDSYLLETDKKPRTQYMTQDFYQEGAAVTNKGIEETVPKGKKKQNPLKQSKGYLGEIVFESNYGKQRQFRLFEDSYLGLGQGCQSIIIDQEWDEDIETDYSCAENAVRKCVRQLNQAVRHQKRGIDPTRPFIHDYTTAEQRFQKENQMIQHDNDQQPKNVGNQDSWKSRIDDSPLLQSKSQIFSQMQNMMCPLDIQSNYVSLQQVRDLDILGSQTKKESPINPFQASQQNYQSQRQSMQQDSHQQYPAQKSESEFDPYIQQGESQYSQSSQQRYLPDFASMPYTNNHYSQMSE